MGKENSKKPVKRYSEKQIWVLFICLLAFFFVSVWLGVSSQKRFDEQNTSMLSITGSLQDMKAEVELLKVELLKAEQLKKELLKNELKKAEMRNDELSKTDSSSPDASGTEASKPDTSIADLFDLEQFDKDFSARQAVLADAKIEFLAEQIKAHQQFIEAERNKLIWMLGIIFTAGGTVIGFFGVKSKNDIEAMLDETYREEINKRVDKMVNNIGADDLTIEKIDTQVEKMLAKSIGGNDNFQYLKSAVKLERFARTKGVYFIEQDGSECLDDVKSWIEERFADTEDCGKHKMVTASQELVRDIDAQKSYFEYDIFVYEVSAEELGPDKKKREDGGDLLYKELSAFCKSKKKQCLLLCKDRINLSNIDGNYTTTVQYVSKLRESLSALLYI